MVKELKRFEKRLLEGESESSEEMKDDQLSARVGALNVTLYFLKKVGRNDMADTLETNELILIRQCELKSNLRRKSHRVFEGIAKQGEDTSLEKIYTELYITEGGSAEVNREHEVRQIEATSRREDVPETPIKCCDLFKQSSGQDKHRTVLTKGVAGIGKSVSVQKFILDWAEGKINQDIKFIFPLPFRELNLKEGKHSLMDILNQYFPETHGLKLSEKHKVLFIFDGLDECRLPLKFQSNETWCDVSKKASLDILLTNLIKGNLLPSALIWITTRPAASNKISPECVDRVSEVRGFTDSQKQEYFRKRFNDEDLANKIISHIKASRSLHIMCHIPVFCWISATVLENILKGNETKERENTPKTLTQMYIHFLIFQTIQTKRKYGEDSGVDVQWDKEGILSLGKLAFHQLEKSNLIFYGEDLRECGIDLTDASLYSGLCTQIFKEESGMFLGSVYCFLHLSLQEFLSSLYAYICLSNDEKNVLDRKDTLKKNENEAMTDMLKMAVDKALESDNGHLDLFLRFLLGLSLQSNQPLLRGLLTGSSSHNKQDIVDYIKLKFEQNSSPERSINLFYCLNELNDDSLLREIQNQLNSGRLSEAELSPAQWSALVFVLMTSEEDLDEFDLQKFIKSDECLWRLKPVVQLAKTAL
ncbi:NLR family CARD domain-containing protein 3-like [Brachyhypopomus gauderio]|uniref:NLR family CARD domain-containing protein 3-like n=1 Tax=Brachyhypopomus gauderio TaxID=698409 RepID=UPI0040415118